MITPAMRQIRTFLYDCAHTRTNAQRLARWRTRYFRHTGISPTIKPYRVAHCIVCNRPHWFTGIVHNHVTARCAGHSEASSNE